MASPGMLQSGFSRQLLEAWCEDSRNAVLLTGYSVEGTMAKLLQTDPSHIESKSGARLTRRCRIDAVSFSAHCDFLQTSEFVDLVKPNHIVLVHGEKNQMARLQDALQRKYNQAEQAANKRRQQLAGGAAAMALNVNTPLAPLWRPQAIHSPENCVTVEVAFAQQGKVRVLGTLAEMVPGIGRTVGGVLVRRDFETSLMAANDLPAYTDLTSTMVVTRTAMPLSRLLWPQLIQALLAVWADVTVVKPEDPATHLPSLLVCGRVSLQQAVAVPSIHTETTEAGPSGVNEEEPLDPRKRRKKAAEAKPVAEKKELQDQDCVILEWTSGTVDDLIADSIAAIVCQCCVSPWAVLQQPRHAHEHDHEECGHDKLRPEAREMVERALVGHFGAMQVAASTKESRVFLVGETRVFVTEEGKWEVDGGSEKVVAEARNVIEKLFKAGIVTGIKARIH